MSYNTTAMQDALATITANHEHHKSYDGYGGYPDSELCIRNEGAIESLKAAILDNLSAQVSGILAWLVKGKYQEYLFSLKSSAETWCKGLNAGYGEEKYKVYPLYALPPVASSRTVDKSAQPTNNDVCELIRALKSTSAQGGDK